MSAGEEAALTPLKGNSANSVCGTFTPVHLGHQRVMRRGGWDGNGGEGLGQPTRGKSIAGGVEQGNGWLITELLTYRSPCVLHRLVHAHDFPSQRRSPRRSLQKFVSMFTFVPRDNAAVSSS